jgi:hypothetical protein
VFNVTRHVFLSWWGEDFGELSRVAPERLTNFRRVSKLYRCIVRNIDKAAEPQLAQRGTNGSAPRSVLVCR